MSVDIKYIGLDIHKEAVSIAVLNGSGKLVMESIIETKAITILPAGTAGRAACDLGRREVGGLVVRSAEASLTVHFSRRIRWTGTDIFDKPMAGVRSTLFPSERVA